jgi:hypothetical protein
MPVSLPSRQRSLPWPSSRIERDVLHSLRMHAQQTGRLTTEVVAEAVTQYLDRQEGTQNQPSADAVGG